MRFASSVSNLLKCVGTKQPDADSKVMPQACVLQLLKAAHWWKMVEKHCYCHCVKDVASNRLHRGREILSNFTPSLQWIFRWQEALGEMPSQTGSEAPFCKRNTGHLFDRSFHMTAAVSVVCLRRYVHCVFNNCCSTC